MQGRRQVLEMGGGGFRGVSLAGVSCNRYPYVCLYTLHSVFVLSTSYLLLHLTYSTLFTHQCT